MIWTSLLIPVIASLVLANFFAKKMIWQEYVAVFTVPTLCILICYGTSNALLTHDTEYLGGYVTSASYEEEWDEWVTQTCTRTVSCGKDCETTETYDCSYRDYHPPKWYVDDSNGNRYGISKEEFHRLVRKFGHAQFVDMHRWYYTIDGDKYVTTCRFGSEKEWEPTTVTHSYENRVQHSSSVFNFPEISKKDVKEKHLFEYPDIHNYTQHSVLPSNYNSFHIDLLNAKHGRDRQIRFYVLVFDNEPYQRFEDQKAYWKLGNKNEFVTCIGMKDGKITWGNVFSWSPAEIYKIEARDYIGSRIGQPLDLKAYADFLEKNIGKWERKHFKEFSYLRVEPSSTAIIVTFILTTVVTIVVSVVCVSNEENN